MANNYTQYSFIVPVDDPVAVVAEYDRLCEDWQKRADDDPDFEDPHPILGSEHLYGVATLIPEPTDTPPHIWFSDDAGEGDLELAIAAVEWIMTKPGSPDEVFFEWASTCSKPRVGEFGGGAVLITRKGVASIHTSGTEDLLRSMIEARHE